MEGTVKIELSDKDAELYKSFCKHYKNIGVLVRSGVFDLRSASVRIDIDQNGIIQDVRRSTVLYTAKI